MKSYNVEYMYFDKFGYGITQQDLYDQYIILYASSVAAMLVNLQEGGPRLDLKNFVGLSYGLEPLSNE